MTSLHCVDERYARSVQGPPWARLWIVDLDDETIPDQAVLPDVEQERSRRFFREVDRRRYLAGRRVLRTVLAREFGLDFVQPFAIGVHGKPAIPGRTSGSFNLSHSGRHALIGVSATHEIGVDIEEARRVPGAEAIAASHFSPGERSSMERRAEAGDSSSTFLDIWTRKEACLKALGCGFSVAGADVDVGDAPLETLVTPSSALASVRVASLTVGRNLVAAVACMEAR